MTTMSQTSITVWGLRNHSETSAAKLRDQTKLTTPIMVAV